MKRLFSLLFLLLLLFSFTSCSSKNSDDPETIVINDEIYTVDPVNGDIAHEDDLYHYTIDGDTITITYPDTSTYWHTYVDEGSWHSGSSDNYNPESAGYVEGSVLMDVIARSQQDDNVLSNSVLAFLCFFLGAFYAIAPREAWYIGHGWWFKDAEPTRLALILGRVAGIFVALFGLGLLLFK